MKHLELDKHFLEFAYVTCVQRITSSDDYPWLIRGCHSLGQFNFRSKKIVLATGVGIPKCLRVANENEDCKRIFHSMTELERNLPKLIKCPTALKPVLVVGDGLSAADVVIKLLISGIPIVHSFRKAPRDTKNVLSKLSSVVYPEYHTVFRLMTGSIADTLYVAHQRTEVVEFQQIDDTNENCFGGRKAILKPIRSKKQRKSSQSEPCIEVEFSYAIILIGFQADLSFFDDNGRHLAVNSSKPIDSKSNVININPFTYQCSNEPDVYAVGPLVGDNFVRYTVGGSLAAASNICEKCHVSSA